MMANAALLQFSIRTAVPDDVPAIALIERAAFPDPWSATAFSQMLREEQSRIAVAVRGAEVVGYTVALFVADEAELANIAVRASDRGLGIGAALLDDALSEGWRRGALNFYLEVRAMNDSAQALYRKAGFREVGRRRRYYSRPVDDAIMMAKARPN
jgi:ribosomal-protein-alanine N-acetyltransferase